MEKVWVQVEVWYGWEGLGTSGGGMVGVVKVWVQVEKVY